MKEWKGLTPEERKAERDKVPGSFERRTRMDACLSATLYLLKDDPFAQAEAWKVTYGNYLINAPEEIAAHCREAVRGKECE